MLKWHKVDQISTGGRVGEEAAKELQTLQYVKQYVKQNSCHLGIVWYLAIAFSPPYFGNNLYFLQKYT